MSVQTAIEIPKKDYFSYFQAVEYIYTDEFPSQVIRINESNCIYRYRS